jgi:ferredoxin
MKARVDRDLCVGIGNCVAIAPTVFKLDKDSKAEVLDPNSIREDKLIAAAESCPVNAIIVEDDQGEQKYP